MRNDMIVFRLEKERATDEERAAIKAYIRTQIGDGYDILLIGGDVSFQGIIPASRLSSEVLALAALLGEHAGTLATAASESEARRGD